MAFTLESIIQKLYASILAGVFPASFNKKTYLAGLILGEIYEIYENNKEKILITELRFFLSIKNPIKHILNILNQSSSDGGMTIKDAIREEYVVIKQELDLNTKITLFSIITDEINKTKINSNNYIQNSNMIASVIITKLNEHRINGNLDHDTSNILSQPDIKNLIVEIIELSNSNNNITDLVIALYKKIDERKFTPYNNISNELTNTQFLIHNETNELHQHLKYIGENIWNKTLYVNNNNENQNSEKHDKHKSKSKSKNLELFNL